MRRLETATNSVELALLIADAIQPAIDPVPTKPQRTVELDFASVDSGKADRAPSSVDAIAVKSVAPNIFLRHGSANFSCPIFLFLLVTRASPMVVSCRLFQGAGFDILKAD
jgi:hypothetical protein